MCYIYTYKYSYMRSFPLLCCLCVATLATHAQTFQDSLSLTPIRPRAGQAVTLSFHSDDTAFTGMKSVHGGWCSLNAKGVPQTTDLVLEKKDGAWVGSLSLPDTTVALVVFLDDATDKPRVAVPTLVYTPSGEVQPSGYKALSMVYSSGEFLFGVKRDVQKADACMQSYYDGVKDQLHTFQDRVAYKMFAKDTAQVLKLLVALPLDTTAEEQDYNVAITTAARLKNKPVSDIMTNLRNTRFPLGHWRKIDFQIRLRNEKDLEKKGLILQDFKTTFPGDSTSASPYCQAMMRSIAGSYIDKGDLPGALRYFPAGLSGMPSALLNNNIAWQACLKDVYLREALALSKASLDTIKAMEASGEGKPSYYTHAAYNKQLEAAYAGNADTYAYLLYKTGDYKKALVYEGEAIKGTAKVDASTVARYHLIMEHVAKPSKVLASLSGYMEKGITDSTMEAQFKRLYQGPGNVDGALAALGAKAAAEKQAEMVKTILNEPASGFVLRDLNGNRVSLDTLRGKTVVLDFWATWCGPCKASFPAMQKIVDKHKADNNIVLLFVDTWETADNKNKNAQEFITASPYTFHVLMDNDNQVVEKYKVSGIPTKFIIDPNGTLRFKAVGFSGDTDGTVEELESMIQLAGKP